MKKVSVGLEPYIYPKPVVLVGANIDGRANFLTAALCGGVNTEPPMISVSIRPSRFTIKGVRQNQTFSVNIPSETQVKEMDYCGNFSGAREDKNKTCGFTVFYAKLESAPFIEECPVNIACSVVHVLKLPTHFLFIGQIEDVHASEDVLTKGLPDGEKIKPIIYCTGTERAYYGLGQKLGLAHRVGLELKKG